MHQNITSWLSDSSGVPTIVVERREDRVFVECPWGVEGQTAIFCYDCHEELLHNPIFLPVDIAHLADLVRERHLDEDTKTESKDKIAGRIKLLHEIIQRGLVELKKGRHFQSGSRGFFSPGPHTTRRAGPHQAVPKDKRTVVGLNITHSSLNK
jgi:hypothetical protein